MSDKIIMPEGMDGSQWNNPFFYLIFLALFGRNGFGGYGSNATPADAQQVNAIQNTLNSQATNNLIMDAIKANGCNLGAIASQLGCTANAMERGFAAVNYNLADQSCQTRQSAKDNTASILAKLDSIEDSRKDREINALTAQLASATARAERQAELAPIIAQLNNISSKQPSTATVTYPNLIGVPASQLYGYNYNGQVWS